MKIKLLKHQLEFVNSEFVNTGLVAGYGSGKSIAGAVKIIKKKLENPGIDVAYYLPTYQLINKIAFKNISHYLNKLNCPFDLNKTDKEFITPYGSIIMRSMDNPQYIVGYEVGYSLIDEIDIMSIEKANEAYDKILGRNRSISNSNIDIVSTPEGFNFMYKFFKDKSKNKNLIRAKTTDNPFLSVNYINNLKERYSDKQLSAYLDGEFVNLTSGTVYYEFNRDINYTDKEAESNILHIGMDFNITNMSAIVHIKENNKIHAVDELTGIYDTFEMIEAIKEKYPDNFIIIYPDASGGNRKTTGISDINLLKKAGFRIKNDKKNPFVKDRINEMNKVFRNNKYLINLETCSEYAEALEQLTYKNSFPDKSSGLDHVTDAGGYFIYQNEKPAVRKGQRVL
jgi:phage terminase large subunit